MLFQVALYLLVSIQTGNGLQKGEVRLIHGTRTTTGSIYSDNKIVSYSCRAEAETPLQYGLISCRPPAGGRNEALAPFFLGNEPFTGCFHPWRRNGNGCYRFINQEASWKSAREECINLGGDLARITETFRMESVTQKSAWFLANDITQERRWEYDAREPLTFTNWAPGEPNNLGGGEDCALIDRLSRWYDGNCKHKLPFLCSRNTLKARISCRGTESRLDQCIHSGIDLFSCGASEMVKISCTYNHAEDGFHAVSSYQGTLQMYYGNQWRFVCEQQFGERESGVVCRQLNGIPHQLYKYSMAAGIRSVTEYQVGCDYVLRFAGRFIAKGRGQFSSGKSSLRCLEASQCKMGYYGRDCREKCGFCDAGSCSVIDGSCPDRRCKPGYTGTNCKQECPSGWWGTNCSNICGHCLNNNCSDVECNKSVCNIVDGSCQSRRCQDGYVGINCKDACENGRWGANCSSVCGHCLNNECGGDTCSTPTCDFVNGSCQSGRCQGGFMGMRCEEVVPVTDKEELTTALTQKNDTKISGAVVHVVCTQDKWLYPVLGVVCLLLTLATGGVCLQFLYFKYKY